MRMFYKAVQIKKIRHDIKECYIREGHGGQEIVKWPIYRFFKEYLLGSKEKAFIDFSKWYREQFSKYWSVSKNLGGMHRGSLYHLVLQECKEKGVLFNEKPQDMESDVVKNAIQIRVQQRFKLLESIKNNGYILEETARVIGIKRRNCVYLKNGHHRASALYLLGYKSIPNVMVFPNETTYKLFKFLRLI